MPDKLQFPWSLLVLLSRENCIRLLSQYRQTSCFAQDIMERQDIEPATDIDAVGPCFSLLTMRAALGYRRPGPPSARQAPTRHQVAAPGKCTFPRCGFPAASTWLLIRAWRRPARCHVIPSSSQLASFSLYCQQSGCRSLGLSLQPIVHCVY